jgi:hypothetical protein
MDELRENSCGAVWWIPDVVEWNRNRDKVVGRPRTRI